MQVKADAVHGLSSGVRPFTSTSAAGSVRVLLGGAVWCSGLAPDHAEHQNHRRASTTSPEAESPASPQDSEFAEVGPGTYSLRQLRAQSSSSTGATGPTEKPLLCSRTGLDLNPAS